MGTIAGTVMTIDGVPISEASVYVASGPSHADLAALTDEFGNFRLSGLSVGVYVIEVSAEGFMAVSGHVPVRSGRVTRADVTLQGEEIWEIEDSRPQPEDVCTGREEVQRTSSRRHRRAGNASVPEVKVPR